MSIHKEQGSIIPEQHIERGLRAVIKEGIMSHLMEVFTGGIFLVGVALTLGASNTQIGLLSAVPKFSQLVQIPAVLLITVLGSRKKVVITSSFIGRSLWLFVAASPFILTPSQSLLVLLGVVFLQSVLGGISGCAWNSWMRDLIPEERLGRFSSLRSRLSIFIGLFASLLASRVIDAFRHGHVSPATGYSFLFAAGVCVGIGGVMFMRKIPDIPDSPRHERFLSMLGRPFRDVNYRRLLFFMAAWNFAVNLAMPFFTVCMLKRLHMSMTGVTALSIVNQMCNLVFVGLWGAWVDRFSNKSVLKVSGPLFLYTILAWTLTSLAQGSFFTRSLLVVLHMLMGITLSGVSVASSNIGLKLAPKGKATPYLVALSLTNATAAGVAAIIGGGLVDLFARNKLSLTVPAALPLGLSPIGGISFQHYDLLFTLAFAAGLYALRRLTYVEERGHACHKAVRKEFLRAIRRPVRSLTIESGLLQLIKYPVRVLFKRKKGRGRDVLWLSD